MRSILVPMFILTVATAEAAHAGVTSTWVGRSAGSWNVSGNWNNGVPGFGAVTDAIIAGSRGGVAVTLDTSPSLSSLSIAPGCSLVQPNSRSISLASLTNDGLWTLLSEGSPTDLIATAAFTNFTGAGTLRLGGGINVRLYGSGGLRTIVNEASHTIAGVGQLGINLNLNLINHGTVKADTNGQSLNIDLSGGDNQNNGMMLATDGGFLILNATPLDNTDGVIRAESNGEVQITNGTVITGGVFETASGGVIRPTSGTHSIVDVHNLGTFTLRNGDAINVFGTLDNPGLVSLESTGSPSDFLVNSGDGSPLTLTGGGSLLLGGHTNNRIYGNGGLRRLVNAADHTIHGGGQIGINLNLNLTNEGVIAADLPGQPLNIDLSAGDNQNDGMMLATDGGFLILNATSLDNTDGVIRAESNGEVQITNGTVITGGVFETASGGVIRPTSGTHSIVDVHNLGTFTLRNGDAINVFGTLDNPGLVSLESTGSPSDFLVNSGDGSPLTLTGGGSLLLGGHANNRIYGNGGLRRLVNAADHTIHGGGQIGINLNLNLTNEGVIAADLPGQPLHIDLSGGDNQNDGLIVARSGAVLSLNATPLDNTDGVIRAETNGEVQITNGTVITGGVFETASGGVIRPTPGTHSIVDVHNVGTFTLRNGDAIHGLGTLTNDGLISMESSGSPTDFLVDFNNGLPLTLSGDGELVLGGHTNNRFYGSGGVARLVNGLHHTIRGGGQIGLNLNFNLTNKGSIIADGALTIDVSNDFTNEGTFRVTGAGSASIQPGSLINEGQFLIDVGTSVSRAGSMNQQDGQTKVDGTLSLDFGSSLFVSGGLVSGDGTINGKVAVSGGSASPSNASGNDPATSELGSLVVNGAYTQNNDGGYVVDLGLAGNDLLTVNGSAILGGALQVRLVGPFTPLPGQEFTILNATSINGVFGCVEFPNAPAGYFTVIYSPTSVKLRVDSIPPQESDLDFDGIVGASDLSVLLGAWGEEPCSNAVCCPADLNGDGKVNAVDLAILLGDWA